MNIRLLIVDDQELVRTGLRLFLETQDDVEVVGEAGDGAEAIERARELRPDVVLMDIRMPGMDGVEATARLTAPGIEPPPRVLVLTTFDLDEYLFGALRAGAAGFLLKDAPRERLLEAIRVVHGGEAQRSVARTSGRRRASGCGRASTSRERSEHSGLPSGRTTRSPPPVRDRERSSRPGSTRSPRASGAWHSWRPAA
jgi:DNA-binding NarL/FixJ family response regulator